MQTKERHDQCPIHRVVWFTVNAVLVNMFLFILGLNYRLEKQDEPGVAVDLDSPLSAMDTLEFCLVRENSKLGRSKFYFCFPSYFSPKIYPPSRKKKTNPQKKNEVYLTEIIGILQLMSLRSQICPQIC